MSPEARLGLVICQSTLSLYWCIPNYSRLNREAGGPCPSAVQQILFQTNSALCFQLVKQQWVFGAKFWFHECLELGAVTQGTQDHNLSPSFKHKIRLKRRAVFWFWGLRLFINFSRCFSHHFWEGKARFPHQHTQQSDWHIYDFFLAALLVKRY